MNAPKADFTGGSNAAVNNNGTAFCFGLILMKLLTFVTESPCFHDLTSFYSFWRNFQK